MGDFEIEMHGEWKEGNISFIYSWTEVILKIFNNKSQAGADEVGYVYLVYLVRSSLLLEKQEDMSHILISRHFSKDG